MDEEEKVSSLAMLMVCLHGIISHHLSGWLTGNKTTNLLMSQPTSQWQPPKVPLKPTKGTGQLISPLLIKRVATLLEILPCPDSKMLSRKDLQGGKKLPANDITTAPEPVASRSPFHQAVPVKIKGTDSFTEMATGKHWESITGGAANSCLCSWEDSGHIPSTSDTPQIFPCPILRV